MLSFRQGLVGVVILVLAVCVGVGVLAVQAVNRAEQLLQRSLASYEHLAAVTRLDAAIGRELLLESRSFAPVEGVIWSGERSVASLLQALSETIDAELNVAMSEQQRSREIDERLDVDRLSEAYRNMLSTIDTTPGNADQLWRAYTELSGMLTSLERAEAEEVSETLEEVMALRDSVGWFVTALVTMPLLLTGGLLWQIYGSHQRLENQVIARTRDLEDKANTLATVDASRRRFFAKIGHELRTPLTVLLAEAEISRKPGADETRTLAALDNIAVQGGLISRRISDLLALARSDAGELVLDLEPTELLPLLERAVTLTRAYAELTGVSINLEIDDIHDAEMLADGEWLTHAVMALIDNAIKASSADQTVTLTGLRRDGNVVIRVADAGQGVEDARLAELTRAFYHEAPEGSNSGVGLGLTVAQWVADQHHGSLELANQTAGGLRVEISVPSL